jgi:hypothetical protein
MEPNAFFKMIIKEKLFEGDFQRYKHEFIMVLINAQKLKKYEPRIRA